MFFLVVVSMLLVACCDLCQAAGYILAERTSLFHITIFTACDGKTQGAERIALIAYHAVQIFDAIILE